jgi:hypothetical protein
MAEILDGWSIAVFEIFNSCIDSKVEDSWRLAVDGWSIVDSWVVDGWSGVVKSIDDIWRLDGIIDDWKLLVDSSKLDNMVLVVIAINERNELII